MPEEMPIWRHYHHQSSDKPREPSHPPVLGQQLQASSPAHPSARPSTRSRGNERYWEKYSTEDPQRETQAKPGQV
ncbi:hypothetical protein GGS20DRAFT_455261 [Poronia punctata]|nr:hypothetical protein GGS20DRAFT_455261 [Poronia punctata]